MSTGIPFIWDNEALVMRPAPEATKRVQRLYEHGETYILAQPRDRSPETHRHFFSLIRMAWENLPEHYAGEYPSEKALRKRALILTGHFDEIRHICATPLDARRLVAVMRPADDFAIVSVVEEVVIIRTAKSQTEDAMDAAEFQASKADVLAFVSSLIGVDVTTLQRQAEAA